MLLVLLHACCGGRFGELPDHRSAASSSAAVAGTGLWSSLVAFQELLCCLWRFGGWLLLVAFRGLGCRSSLRSFLRAFVMLWGVAAKLLGCRIRCAWVLYRPPKFSQSSAAGFDVHGCFIGLRSSRRAQQLWCVQFGYFIGMVCDSVVLSFQNKKKRSVCVQ